jgi:hypothetical protein
MKRACLAALLVGPAAAVPPGTDDGTRVVPVYEVRLNNRLATPVTVKLMPDVGESTLEPFQSKEFACMVVKGFELAGDSKSYNAHCGRRYAVSTGANGRPEIVELVKRPGEL